MTITNDSHRKENSARLDKSSSNTAARSKRFVGLVNRDHRFRPPHVFLAAFQASSFFPYDPEAACYALATGFYLLAAPSALSERHRRCRHRVARGECGARRPWIMKKRNSPERATEEPPAPVTFLSALQASLLFLHDPEAARFALTSGYPIARLRRFSLRVLRRCLKGRRSSDCAPAALQSYASFLKAGVLQT